MNTNNQGRTMWYRIIWNDGHESEICCSEFEINVILSRIEPLVQEIELT
jgi:hypothetical protein